MRLTSYALLSCLAVAAGGGGAAEASARVLASANATVANATAPTYAPTYAPTAAPAAAAPTRQPSTPRPTHAVAAVPAPTREGATRAGTKAISSGASDDDEARSTMLRAATIVGVAVACGLLLCLFPPLRRRCAFVVEVATGAHGLPDFQAKRQTYYRSKLQKSQEHAPLVGRAADEPNPFRASADEDDILVV